MNQNSIESITDDDEIRFDSDTYSFFVPSLCHKQISSKKKKNKENGEIADIPHTLATHYLTICGRSVLSLKKSQNSFQTK